MGLAARVILGVVPVQVCQRADKEIGINPKLKRPGRVRKCAALARHYARTTYNKPLPPPPPPTLNQTRPALQPCTEAVVAVNEVLGLGPPVCTQEITGFRTLFCPRRGVICAPVG